jgi:hypothetical protein
MSDPDRSDSDTSTTERPAVVGPILLAITILGVLFIEFCGMARESAELATL